MRYILYVVLNILLSFIKIRNICCFLFPGHVITGCTAGYDYSASVLYYVSTGIDNVFALTISGDLGQSGLEHNAGTQKIVISGAPLRFHNKHVTHLIV